MELENKPITVSTKELWNRLFQASSIENYFTDNRGICEMQSFSGYITELCENRNEKPAQVLKRCNIERTFGHRLFSGKRNPSRDTVLQLAFAFQMTIDETQQMLKIAHFSYLHPKVPRDAVIAYCLYTGKSLTDTQRDLYDNKFPLIGGSKSGQ